MADPGYTSNYSADAPGNATPTHPSYYDYMTAAFLGHCSGLPPPGLDAAAGGEQPLSTLDPDSNQSGTCARLAVEFYNRQEGNSPITLDRAKDSHKFFSQGTAYFHVNFKAAFDGGSGHCYTFFAEVEGPGGVPESATMVVQFHTKEERRTRDNCLYCTGLSHPEEGGFVGHDGGEGGDDDHNNGN
ncbi:hypothetical protein SETIT_2G094500v2 [Setaria italica]|uniref:DUF3615 domain-containing protein n=1 Tax=Setaria italica TaxID=4555 RepID=K3ZZI2_SETIT|nr:hypothetical protein SETIT_2G094500v2 [Setaria italica]